MLGAILASRPFGGSDVAQVSLKTLIRDEIVTELGGRPGRWRLVRATGSILFFIALVLIVPRVDQWPDPSLILGTFGVGCLFGAVENAHRQRLLERPRHLQVAAFFVSALGKAAIVLLFVALSIAVGPELGQSPFERLGWNGTAPTDGVWPLVYLIAMVGLAFLAYRTLKRNDADIRAQAASERRPQPGHPGDQVSNVTLF